MPAIASLTLNQPKHWPRCQLSELAQVIAPARDEPLQEGDVVLRADLEDKRLVVDQTPGGPSSRTGVAIVRPNGKMLPEALAWWLSDDSNARAMYALVAPVHHTGSLRWSILGTLTLAVPDLEEQQRFLEDRATSVALLEEHSANMRRLVDTMDRLARSLSHTMLKGEVDREEARRIVRDTLAPQMMVDARRRQSPKP